MGIYEKFGKLNQRPIVTWNKYPWEVQIWVRDGRSENNGNDCPPIGNDQKWNEEKRQEEERNNEPCTGSLITSKGCHRNISISSIYRVFHKRKFHKRKKIIIDEMTTVLLLFKYL